MKVRGTQEGTQTEQTERTDRSLRVTDCKCLLLAGAVLDRLTEAKRVPVANDGVELWRQCLQILKGLTRRWVRCG